MDMSQVAEELLVYADNEVSLNKHKDAILKNYAKKMSKGVFDRDLAIKGLLPLVTTAAKMYGDEFMSKDEWKTVFSVEDRKDVAAAMADAFVEEYEFQKDQTPAVDDAPVDEEMGVMESADEDEDEDDVAPKSHYVWAWGNNGKKILFRGTEDACDEFKSEYRGYPQDDIYVSKSSMDEDVDNAVDYDDDDDEDESPYEYMMKNKGRIAKVENRPAKTPKPTLGEDDEGGEKYIEITYEIVSPESAENGEAEEIGWADESGNRYSEYDDSLKISMTPDEYDAEEGLTAVDLAVKTLKKAGARYPNDSRLPTSYGTGENTDYASGNVETLEYHLNGFSEEELMEIKHGLMVR